MSSRRGRRIAFSWIAVLAILMVTFAPTATGLLSASRGLAWEQVCSATGPAVAADAADASGHGAPEAPAGTHTFEHCPYCALHADLAPLPDPLTADAGTPLVFRAFPPAFLQAPRAGATWSTAQPRAPPVLA